MFLFDNAGRRIKNVINILFWISVAAHAISAIIAGIGIGDVGGFFVTVLLIVLGFFVSWLSALLLYAFGELCENIMSVEDDTRAIRKKLEEMEKRSGDAGQPSAT